MRCLYFICQRKFCARTHVKNVLQSIIALKLTFLFISEKLFLSIVENGGQETGVFNLS